MFKRIFTAFFSLLPLKLDILFLNLLGHKISWNSRLGLNLYLVDHIHLKKRAKVGYFNFIKIDKLELSEEAEIGHANIFKGPFSVRMQRNTRIGKLNKLTRAYAPISYGESYFDVGEGTRITYDNFFDLTLPISFGNYSQVAGKDSQFWTHGYYHADEGPDRIRVDGKITIGNNVYIGSRCLLNPGVTIGDAINLGGNSVVSKDILESGMYVNQPLRYIDTDINKLKTRLKKVEFENLIEVVYTKEK